MSIFLKTPLINMCPLFSKFSYIMIISNNLLYFCMKTHQLFPLFFIFLSCDTLFSFPNIGTQIIHRFWYSCFFLLPINEVTCTRAAGVWPHNNIWEKKANIKNTRDKNNTNTINHRVWSKTN